MANENEEELEQFSDDPEEQLRMENELLKLKMQAQFGAFFGGGNEELPPEIEQEFLKQVLAFQENHASAPLVKFHDVIGNTEYKLSTEIPEAELEAQWAKLEKEMGEHGLIASFETEYPTATKYDFVINELFPLEIQQPQEGHNWVFPYEEFHPNHALTLERSVASFMEDFFGNKIEEDAFYLAHPLITDKGEPIPVKDFIEKVDRFHHFFRELKDYKYEVLETRIDEPQKEGGTPMGFVEGSVEYNVVTEDSTEQTVRGSFKCYFQNTGYWEMYFFWLHGFPWG